jgi:hypothetical protein
VLTAAFADLFGDPFTGFAAAATELDGSRTSETASRVTNFSRNRFVRESTLSNGTRSRLSRPRSATTVESWTLTRVPKEVLMSQLRTVPQAEWRSFFDRTSKALLGQRAEIEVASLALGNQIVAEWLPMIGITYDSRDDLLDVALDRSSHLIRHPKEIVVEESEAGLKSVSIVDADGARQTVRLKTPLMLPSAEVHR